MLRRDAEQREIGDDEDRGDRQSRNDRPHRACGLDATRLPDGAHEIADDREGLAHAGLGTHRLRRVEVRARRTGLQLRHGPRAYLRTPFSR